MSRLLLAVAAGASGAAKKNSVTSKSIKDGQVHGVDVKDDSLTGADIDEGSPVDADGVALAAIKALAADNRRLEERVAALEEETK